MTIARVCFAVLLLAAATACPPAGRGDDEPQDGRDDDGRDGEPCAADARECDGETPLVCEDGRMVRQDACDGGTVCAYGRCQDLCEAAAARRSYEGCEVYAVDLPNAFVESASIDVSPRDGEFAVVVSNGDPEAAARVIVTTDAGDGEEEVDRAEVGPRSTHVFELGRQNVEGTGTEGRAFRVRANRPITAYQFNPLNNTDEAFSNDASLLLPTAVLDREYVAVTGDALMGTRDDAGTPASWGAFVAVVGVGDEPVHVEVTPTAQIDAGQRVQGGMGPYEADLSRYEVLNLESLAVEGGPPGSGNLSGTHVLADGPVAVFAGNVATISPTGPGATCCADHLEEQMWPLPTWGTRYFGVPSQNRGVAGQRQDDVWRITAGDAPVDLDWSPAPPPGAKESLEAFESIELSTSDPFGLVATGRVMLARFLTSSDQVIENAPCDPLGDAGECPFQPSGCAPVDETSGQCVPLCELGEDGDDCPYLAVCNPIDGMDLGVCQALSDPSLILVPPVEQFRADYVFLTPEDYEHDYVDVLVPGDATVEIDGEPVTNLQTLTLGDETFGMATIELRRDGTHGVAASAPVGLLVYGIDRYVSYGYPAGLDLEEVPLL